MTPRELMLCVEDYNVQREQQRADLITQAYFIAAWHPRRTRRLPKLDRVLADLKPKESTKPTAPQTDEQMLAAAMRWQKRLAEEEG